jgi:SWI/SNF-related matrix-associated actin-dependent regulator 1 of chromatin subfamily A
MAPKVAKKWVELDSYFAQKIANDKLLSSVPTKVYVEKLLVEKDTAYHIWGKYFESEQVYDFWIPKVALIKDNKVKDVVIDYEKYSHRPPLEHQKEAIKSLVENKKFILADDMGLGKTTSTIIAALETGAKKILIICPASLKINWQREIENYSNRPTSIVEGKKWEDGDFIIINYDIIKNFHDEKKKSDSVLLKTKFDLVIIDEAHYIQNKQAQRTKLINDFVSNVDRLWLLTGTPITSRPINYFNLLNLIECPVAKNWMAYVKRYCNGFQFQAGRRKIWNVSGASNLEELRDRTAPLVLRRLKENVLDLPDKIITPVYLRLKSKEYEALMGEYYDWYDKNGESDSLTLQFTKLTKVRQVIAEEKVASTIEICENIVEQGKKVIVFTNFTKTLEMILEHFGKKAVRLDGQMSQKERQMSVDRFQNEEDVMVFVGNIKAAGVGITLTAGEAVVMNDLSFLPSDHSQAEDRSYRYGQKNNVLVYYPIFDNTVEGIIYDILKKKKDIFETVMGDKVDNGDYVQEILELINNWRR